MRYIHFGGWTFAQSTRGGGGVHHWSETYSVSTAPKLGNRSLGEKHNKYQQQQSSDKYDIFHNILQYSNMINVKLPSAINSSVLQA